jgi:hypothetical protein
MKRLFQILLFCGCAGCAFAQTNIQSVQYSYDANGRLASAYYTRGTTNMAVLFTYDPNGNRLRRTDYGLTNAAGDLDGDSLHDVTELGYFGDLDETGTGDPDADGLVNSNEFALGGNPTLSDTDDDGQDDREESITGTALDDGAEYFDVTNSTRVAGQLRVMCEARAGRTYQLQRCVQPTETWSNEGSLYIAASDGAHYFDVPSTTNQSAFRIKVWLTP